MAKINIFFSNTPKQFNTLWNQTQQLQFYNWAISCTAVSAQQQRERQG